MGTGAGQIVFEDDIAAIEDSSSDKPAGRMVQSGAQTGILNNVLTACTFTTEDFDTHGFHSTSVLTSRVTPTVSGLYDVRGGVSITGQTDYTTVEAVIRFNGNAIAPAHRITPSAGSQTLVIPATAFVVCNGSTDYFEIAFRLQRSGAGTSGTVVSSQFASVLEWAKERDLV